MHARVNAAAAAARPARYLVPQEASPEGDISYRVFFLLFYPMKVVNAHGGALLTQNRRRHSTLYAVCGVTTVAWIGADVYK